MKKFSARFTFELDWFIQSLTSRQFKKIQFGTILQ
ncbi:hypothetical protein DSUL_20188 [Desulfovibrionales bacterium]